MAIAIRTAVHARRAWRTCRPARAIVADSDPATEEPETRNKARAVLQAIATAETLRPELAMSRSSARREFGGVLAAAALAGALALSAGGQTVGTRSPTVRHAPLPPVTVAVAGLPTPLRWSPRSPAWSRWPRSWRCSPSADWGAVAVGAALALAGGLLAWSGVRVAERRAGIGGCGERRASAAPRDTAVTVARGTRLAGPRR